MEYFRSVQNRLRRASRPMLAALSPTPPRESKVLALKLLPDDGQGGAGEPQ